MPEGILHSPFHKWRIPYKFYQRMRLVRERCDFKQNHFPRVIQTFLIQIKIPCLIFSFVFSIRVSS